MITEQLKEFQIIPVLKFNNENELKIVFEGLKKSNLKLAEITCRTPYAMKAIEYAKLNYSDFLIGAGTITNVLQAKQAIKLGVRFIVGPGFDMKVAKYCRTKKIDYIPGCITPTEIMQAVNMGLNVLKYFPASVYGGATALKSLSGVFPNIMFVPTGGVNAENIAEYLTLNNVLCVGASAIMGKSEEEVEGNVEKLRNVIKGKK